MDVLGQCGTANLARSLNRILVDHIRHLLPRLRQQIDDALQKRAAELRVYGDQPPGSTGIARWVIESQPLSTWLVAIASAHACACWRIVIKELAGLRSQQQQVFLAAWLQ